MGTLFVSDLHLDPFRPEATSAFLRFLRDDARGCDALYVLGDLFEAWVGDDDPAPTARDVAAGLAGLAATGVPVHFMRGNRDFLVGGAYADQCAMRLLPDPCVVDLYGRDAVLMHGDLLCSDDLEYQAFRRQVRDPGWQSRFLSSPLAERQAYANDARAASRQRFATISLEPGGETITDVSPATVTACFARFGVDLLIHGHTHRPAVHRLEVEGRPCTRIVLGDWYEQGSVLRVERDGFSLDALPLGPAA